MGLLRYSCWYPKVMAAKGRLPDTLADRCILIRMQRKAGREACERLRSLAVFGAGTDGVVAGDESDRVFAAGHVHRVPVGESGEGFQPVSGGGSEFI